MQFLFCLATCKYWLFFSCPSQRQCNLIFSLFQKLALILILEGNSLLAILKTVLCHITSEDLELILCYNRNIWYGEIMLVSKCTSSLKEYIKSDILFRRETVDFLYRIRSCPPDFEFKIILLNRLISKGSVCMPWISTHNGRVKKCISAKANEMNWNRIWMQFNFI